VATYEKLKLGASTNGRPIKVDQTAIATGTTIHTGSTTTTTYDEIWLYAMNSSTASVKLTIGWGGTSDPDDLIEVTVLPEAGLVTVVPGLVLKGAATALIVKAAAATANVITIHGFVNQITA
jgi:hypothetical protein